MKALSFDDITLLPRYNNIPSRKLPDTSVSFGSLILDIPVLSSNMDTITGSKMAIKIRKLGGLGFLHRFCSIEDNISMYQRVRAESAEAVISIGTNEELNRFAALHEVGAKFFCVDVAHGHSKAVGELIGKIKSLDDSCFIIAGNVCTQAGAEYLAGSGADAIKVGIGPGSVCSTRMKTGFGLPQFTAIQECRRTTCLLIADGGIRYPGDAVKAFAAGADLVMLGGMLAGTDETPGNVIRDDSGSLFKLFRGMASKEAQEDYMGSMNDWKTAEGIEITVQAKGPVEDVIKDLMGGIRSGMTYCGANNLHQIRERAIWAEITSNGVLESMPHGAGRL